MHYWTGRKGSVYDKGTKIGTMGKVGRESFMTWGYRYAQLDRLVGECL